MLVFAHCSARVFSGRPSNNKDLHAWLDLEADLTGDLVVFPCKGGNFNTTPKFVGGMRWVVVHCPTVKKVTKIDDGVMIHPFKLQKYYRQEVIQKPEYLQCEVNVNSDVIRDPQSRYYVPEEDLPARKYGNFCAGASVTMTYAVMRVLLRAASIISTHPT
ncbi:hypothetical protein V5799_012675, partial [Amblyomma americanum]